MQMDSRRPDPGGLPGRVHAGSGGPRWRTGPVVVSICTLLLIVTVVSDVAVSPHVVVLTVFLVLAPLVASAAVGPEITAGFALAATVVAALSWLWNHGGSQYWVRLGDVVLVSTIAVFACIARVRRERDLQASQQIATIAQQALLPVLPEHLGTVQLGTRYHSATQSARVGGDFYDFVTDHGRTRLILGDVSGKGIDAVTQAARVIRAFRQYGASEPDLLSAARRIDSYVQPFWQQEFYATAVLVEWTEPAAVLSVVSCGHPAPLHVSRGQVTELQVSPCLPLGLGPADEVTGHAWAPGDRLLLFTDGLIEARDQRGAFMPRAFIDAAMQQPTVETSLDALLDAVERHAGGFNDDLALLLLSLTPVEAEDSSTGPPSLQTAN